MELKEKKKLWGGIAALALVTIAAGAWAYQGQTGSLQLRVGVIRGNGDVYPAARSQFHLAPYRFDQLQNELRSLNKVGASPAPPEYEDKNFEPKVTLKSEPEDPEVVYERFEAQNPRPSVNNPRFETDCTYYEFIEETRCVTDFNAYRQGLARWEQSRNRRYQQAKVAMKAWKQQRQQFEDARQAAYEKAYAAYRKKLESWVHQSEAHLDQVLQPKIQAQPVVHLQTDLDGRGATKVPRGDWFLSGGNATNFTLSYWQEMPLTMTRSSQALELANDTSDVKNRNLMDDDQVDLADVFFAYTPPETAKAEPLAGVLADPDYLKLQLSYRDITDLKNYGDWTLLHMMAASAPVEVQAELTHLLLLHGAELNAQTQEGDTPLHLAVRHGGRSAAMLLLAYGADQDAINKAGNTPLHEAVLQKSEPMVTLLLRHQANTQQVSTKGQTPLDLAKQLKQPALIKLLDPQPEPSQQPSAKPTAKSTAKPSTEPKTKSSPKTSKTSAQPNAKPSPTQQVKK